MNSIFLFKVSGNKLESSQTHFSFLQNAIQEQTQVFSFRGFFCLYF
jgi:hypothetical protein